MSDNQIQNQTKRPLPAIFGCFGTSLTAAERSFLTESNPLGIILFKRNCAETHQLHWLIKEIKQAIGREDVAILIDQEGGRVSRLQPPNWMQHPPARAFGAMYEKDPEWGLDAIHCYARLVANELTSLGINVNCAPVVDLAIEGATNAIGDRAYSRQPAVVAALARACAETFLDNGLLPVIKHFPGHGRLKTDPHMVLPVIETSRAELESDDFKPFELLKDLPIGMNSHAIFADIDRERPASLSPTIHQEIIRGFMGFDGLMLSDDLTMKALNGAPADLARRALDAGSDVVLHCSGALEEMMEIAQGLDPMADEAWERWQHARSMVNPADPAYKPDADLAQLDLLLGGIAYEAKTIA